MTTNQTAYVPRRYNSPRVVEFREKLPRSLPRQIHNAVLRCVGREIFCSFEEFKQKVLFEDIQCLHLKNIGPSRILELRKHLSYELPVVLSPFGNHDERNRQIVENWNNGETQTALAQRWKLSNARIMKILRRASERECFVRTSKYSSRRSVDR